MAYELRDMSGSLFKNKRKEKDNHPDREGKVMVDGKTYWLKGWDKKDKNGEPWVSLSFNPADEKTESTSTKKPDPLDDELAF